MSFEIIDLCKFYFNMIDLNDNKSCNQSNQVRFGFLYGGRERKSVESLEDEPWSFWVESQGTIPLNGFGESEEANYISTLSKVGTCKLIQILTKMLVRSG